MANMPMSIKLSQERGTKIAQGLRNHRAVVHKTTTNATNNINININIITTGNNSNTSGLIKDVVAQSAENLVFLGAGRNTTQQFGPERKSKFSNIKNIDGKVPYLVSPQSTKAKASRSLIPHTIREEQRQSMVNMQNINNVRVSSQLQRQ